MATGVFAEATFAATTGTPQPTSHTELLALYRCQGARLEDAVFQQVGINVRTGEVQQKKLQGPGGRGTCHARGCYNVATKRCARCQMAGYCCVQCQRADWDDVHKRACQLFRKGKQCVICHKLYIGHGNNAQPVQSGLCCDDCNVKVVEARSGLLPSGHQIFVNLTREEQAHKEAEAQQLKVDFEAAWAAHGDLQRMYEQGSVQFCANLDGHERMGHDRETVSQWAGAAFGHLNNEMQSKPFLLLAGQLGSVWFDCDLTAFGKTKPTRVCFYRGTETAFRLMLDMTSESEW